MSVPARSESTTPTVGKCAPPRITESSRYGTSLRTPCGVSSSAGISQDLACEQRRRSSCIRSGVRATSMPPLSVNTPRSLYCSVLSLVSSIIILEYSIGKMKFDACPVDPPGFGIGPLSTSTRSRQPRRARWYARLLPTIPAPIMTARAWPGTSFMRGLPLYDRSPTPAAGPSPDRLWCCYAINGPAMVLDCPPAGALLDRDLLVDQTEVDALAPADEPRHHVHHYRQYVHRPHVVQ